MTALELPRRQRLPLLLAVALAHVLLWGLLRQAGVWRERTAPPAPRPPLQVWLLQPDAARPTAPAPDRARTKAASATPRTRSPIPDDAVIHVDATPPVAAETPASAPPHAAPAPLVLDLPRGASAPRHSAALDDPRANTARPTLESRIAAVTGDDHLVEEHLPDDVVRFRKGNACIELHRSRDGVLDPFNGSVIPRPRAGKAC